MRPIRHQAILVTGLTVLIACGSEDSAPDDRPVPPQVNTVGVTVDAGAITGTLRPLWRDHYDLSYTHRNYGQEPGFVDLISSLEPRTLRCSVGRWEVGFPPPAGGDSLDPLVLQTVEREFYRGANTLVEADNPSNYNFVYLDAQLDDLEAQGLEPFLCFDYMPFTLSSEQDPMNADNLNISAPAAPYSKYSFSNGIRTAPPSDPAVYGRVVRNTIRHVRGLFGGTKDYGVEYIEIGNEPDISAQVTGIGPPFWSGDRTQWISMYQAVATEVGGDVSISGLIELGGGSFAFLDFAQPGSFLGDVVSALSMAGTRLDYLSFHTYGDTPEIHLSRFFVAQSIMTSLGVSIPWVNAEWGRALDGQEPAYNQIEHGLLRTKVLGLMQLFPFTHAHEALLRDVGPGGNQLGLVRTGPPAHKPVSDAYRMLSLLNPTLEALQVTAPEGTFVLAARDAAGTQVVCIAAVDVPLPGEETRIELELQNLPFVGSYQLERLRVTQDSSDSGVGVEVVDSEVRSGASTESAVQVPVGEEGLYCWRLTAL